MYSQFPEALFGWYRTSFVGEENFEKDILNSTELLAQEGMPKFDDYFMNGQHCKSGLAFYDDESKAAMCADPANMTIMQGDRVITKESAYECDPRDNEVPCTVFFN